VGANDLTRLSYVQALVLGTLTTINVIVPGTAGATIVAGQLVYFDDPTNKWKLADADTAATVENVLLGIAQGAGTDTNPIAGGVLLQGVDAHQSGLTNGQTYYASNTAGGVSSASGTTTVVVGIGKSATELYFAPKFNQTLTQNEIDAMAGSGSFGTPSSSNKFITQTYLATAGAPTQQIFEVSGTWTKPAGLKYIEVELQAPGGGSAGSTNSGVVTGGGGAGGYSRKRILAADLGATEVVTIGAQGAAGSGGGGNGGTGGTTSFGAHCSATGGTGSVAGGGAAGDGGIGSGGDINIAGQAGINGYLIGTSAYCSGTGGAAHLGGGAKGIQDVGVGASAGKYGGGGGGPKSDGGDYAGGSGGPGVIIITEHYI
jgi:hypothetical protein